MRELLVPPQQLAAWAVTNDPKEADKVVFMHILPGLLAYVVPAIVAAKLGDQDLALEYATFSLVRHAQPRPLRWHAAQIARPPGTPSCSTTVVSSVGVLPGMRQVSRR